MLKYILLPGKNETRLDTGSDSSHSEILGPGLNLLLPYPAICKILVAVGAAGNGRSDSFEWSQTIQCAETTSPSWSSLCSVRLGLCTELSVGVGMKILWWQSDHRCWVLSTGGATWPACQSAFTPPTATPNSSWEELMGCLEMIWDMFGFLELLSQTNFSFMGSHVRINSLAFWYDSLNGWLMNSSKVSNFHVRSTSDFAGKLNLAFFSVFV